MQISDNRNHILTKPNDDAVEDDCDNTTYSHKWINSMDNIKAIWRLKLLNIVSPATIIKMVISGRNVRLHVHTQLEKP